METSKLPRFVRLIVFHNPFYLISTCLFVYGLKLLFRPGSSDILFQPGTVGYIPPWHLMLSLSAVTLLMAVTAVGIIRYGRVWEDARSLMLIVLLMFLAIAVSFDEIATLVTDQSQSLTSALLLGGAQAVFMLFVTEMMIHGMQIRLSWLYRGPLYLLLLLMLGWPLLLVPDASLLNSGQTRWAIAAFPTVAGLLTLLLLPAIRQGAALCNNNGTPWRWPLVPWTAFVFVALAICFRAYSLTISFDAPSLQSSFWDTSFGLYFLVPFALAVLVLLLEIGIVERIQKLQNFTLLAAPVLLLVSYPWLVPWMQLNSYAIFVYEVTNSIGSPVFLTLIALVVFYGWAWWRGVLHADLGAIAMLLLAVFIGPGFAGQRIWSLEDSGFHPWPLLALGPVLVAVGIQRRSSRETFVGLLCLALAAGFSTAGTPLADYPALTTYHLGLAALYLTGAFFRDEFAEQLRYAGAPFLTLSSLGALVWYWQDSNGLLSALSYAGGLTVFAWLYGQLLRESLYTIVAVLHVSLATVGSSIWGIHAFFQLPMPRGLRHVILAGLCFVLALGISLLKGSRSQLTGRPGINRHGPAD